MPFLLSMLDSYLMLILYFFFIFIVRALFFLNLVLLFSRLFILWLATRRPKLCLIHINLEIILLFCLITIYFCHSKIVISIFKLFSHQSKLSLDSLSLFLPFLKQSYQFLNRFFRFLFLILHIKD